MENFKRSDAQFVRRGLQEPMVDHRVLVFTALEDPENTRLERHLEIAGAKRISPHNYKGISAEQWVLPQENGEAVSVLVKCLNAAGNGKAGVEVMRALIKYQPSLIAFCGIAGTLSPLEAPLGSVVVSDKILWAGFDKIYVDEAKPVEELMREKVHNEYILKGPIFDELKGFVLSETSGKTDDVKFDSDPHFRKKVIEGLADWQERHFPNLGDDVKGLDVTDLQAAPKPKLSIGQIMSWEYVLNSRERREKIKKENPELLAVEMESGALSYATLYAKNVLRGYQLEYIAVRGISDLCSKKSDDIFRDIASDGAAAFLVGFLKSRFSDELIVAK